MKMGLNESWQWYLSLGEAPKATLTAAFLAASGAIVTALISVTGVLKAAKLNADTALKVKDLERQNKIYELYLPEKKKAIDDLVEKLSDAIPPTIELCHLIKNIVGDPSAQYFQKAVRNKSSGVELEDLKSLWEKLDQEVWKLLATGGVENVNPIRIAVANSSRTFMVVYALAYIFNANANIDDMLADASNIIGAHYPEAEEMMKDAPDQSQWRHVLYGAQSMAINMEASSKLLQELILKEKLR